MKISAPHIANLFDYASYQGISESSLRQYLAKQGLDVCNQQNTVSETEFLNVFETLVNKSNNSYFGLYYGCYLNIKALGFIVELSLNASSIEQAVFLLKEYLVATFPLVSLSEKKENHSYSLQLDCPLEDVRLKNHLLDTVFCFIYRELKLMLSDELFPMLQLPCSNTKEYSKLLNSNVYKGDMHSIVFNNRVLKTEMNKKRVKEIEYLLPKFMMMLDKKKSGYMGFSRQMRNMILNMCCPELPAFAQVSNQFPLSDRTIQRKLTEEGLSFRKIADDIKKELSYYLAKGKFIKTQDIAYILGYSEPSAYLHAVKRWETGIKI